MDLEIALRQIVKHLPGQHDQASHGRGRGGKAAVGSASDKFGGTEGTKIGTPQGGTAWNPAVQKRVDAADVGDEVFVGPLDKAYEVQHEAENHRPGSLFAVERGMDRVDAQGKATSKMGHVRMTKRGDSKSKAKPYGKEFDTEGHVISVPKGWKKGKLGSDMDTLERTVERKGHKYRMSVSMLVSRPGRMEASRFNLHLEHTNPKGAFRRKDVSFLSMMPILEFADDLAAGKQGYASISNRAFP